jgi:fused signal recognition particle receptor
MRRWFRRQGKEQEKREEEEALLSDAAELATEPGEAPPAGDTPATAAAKRGETEVAAPEEVFPEEEAAAAPPERRGFFRRWRQSAPGEAAVPPILEESAVESEVAGGDAAPELPPQPPLPPESETPEVTPPPAEPGVEATPAETEMEAIPPDLPAEQDLEVTDTAEAERRGRFRRLRARLTRTREALSGGLDRLVRGRKVIDAELLEDLEELLIMADLGVDTSLLLIQALQEKLKRRELGDPEKLKAALKAEMVALLTAPAPEERHARPWVVMLVGVNGVGKTTSIAKLAHRDRRQGLLPLLVAADTFRAAAAEQLEIWAERVGAALVKQKAGADPAAVVFDGLAAALAREVDTVYVDTAGRLHTKVNLMEELKKIHRTAAKKIPGAPHEVLLILDATTGQNALSQARLFHEAVGVTGLIFTKMDGTAKGGVALAVVHETGIPLRYIGVGEGMEDLRLFDPEAFVEAILG